MADGLPEPVVPISTALAAATETLAATGIEEPRREARLLLAHALGLEPAALFAHSTTPVPASFAALVARRAAREPFAHITGRREFWGMDFEVGPDVLIPRPDSETLIEAALAAFPERGAVARVLDLGTGSGCLLAASLVEFPAAHGIGVDRSLAALQVARRNLISNGLVARARLIQADWHGALAGCFDLVLCNPPYVSTRDLDTLAPELDFEPPAALAAGQDGFDAWRALLPGLAAKLSSAGRAVLELGIGQAGTASGLAKAAGLQPLALRHDLAGIPRALVLAAAGRP